MKVEENCKMIEINLNDGWKLQSEEKVKVGGNSISVSGYSTEGWYDAKVPSTILSTLVNNGVFKDIFYGMNLRKLPGVTNKIGTVFSNQEMDSESPFAKPWWYRKEFHINESLFGDNIILKFNGLNYRANIWINGKKIADSKNIVGTFRRFTLNISKFARRGDINTLAVEIFPPKAKDLGITFVDWNPTPPDKNMGIWQDVTLSSNNGLELRNPTVETVLVYEKDGNSADLKIRVGLKNYKDSRLKGIISGRIVNHNLDIDFKEEIEIDSNEEKEISIPGNGFIRVREPKLWWPYTMGAPNLHTLIMDVFLENGYLSDSKTIRFGISQVTSERTEDDQILLKVNNKPVLIKGAGWTPDMLLRRDEEKRKAEFDYVKDLGLNTIRLEGKLEDEHFFEIADEEGILVIAGWCCCDAWEKWKLWDEENFIVAANSLMDQLSRLRHHPSIILWMNGSDYIPPENVEKMYLDIEKEIHWNKPVVSSAKNLVSKLTGFSGVKMNGPYDYVPPVYWYIAKDIGGARGFNTETGPGPAIPTVEELKTFIPKKYLWPINKIWNYHAGGGAFKTIDLFKTSLEKRYGDFKSLEDFVWKSQASNYEAQRVMFEAYNRERYRATGVVQWMLNNAWPGIIWHLYSYNMIGAGGYFGTKKALEQIHVQYSYDDSSVVAINTTSQALKEMKLRAEIYDLGSKKIWEKEKNVNLEADSTNKVFSIPNITETTYLLSLRLFGKNENMISDNFYWLSAITEEDLDYENSTFYHTPQRKYADFKGLQNLKKVKLDASRFTTVSGNCSTILVSVKNQENSVAFLVRLRLVNRNDDSDITPAIFEENYFPLLPHEMKSIRVKVKTNKIHDTNYSIMIDGFNAEKVEAK